MLIWILEHLEIYSTEEARVFLTARIAMASVTSFVMALALGPYAIRWLKARFTERIASDSEKLNELHKNKQQTPTMGGIFIVAAIDIALLLWGDLRSPLTLLGLYTVTSFGALGAYDDWIKLRTRKNGLRPRQKFAIQVLLAAVAAIVLYRQMADVPRGLDLIWPIGNASLALGGVYLIWATFVMVGSSNAVNLTDGLDGLACGCTIFAGSAFAALSYLAGHRVLADYLSIPFIPGAGEVAILLGALVGAMLGFLWFNCYPAQVFMGDTGSLAIGAVLALAALVTRQEVLLAVIGGIFVIETISVILQVGWYRLTGRRLIACSPLHNHYLFKGEHEIKIVVRFWIGAAVLAIVGMAMLNIR